MAFMAWPSHFSTEWTSRAQGHIGFFTTSSVPLQQAIFCFMLHPLIRRPCPPSSTRFPLACSFTIHSVDVSSPTWPNSTSGDPLTSLPLQVFHCSRPSFASCFIRS
ncbi:hypothetical protein VNO77_38872 [Canavalia gladiata]|uniref:Uncharacterized protein n=1 Tax=Canavalia gladiata TaxID=3824 RepID=A0AAN9PX90_CANGL